MRRTANAPSFHRPEKELLVGGALSATGLYVGQQLASFTYNRTHALVDRLLASLYSHGDMAEEDLLTIMPRNAYVRRTYTGWIQAGCPTLFARDIARGGGGLMLTKFGIFYMDAPNYLIYELRHGKHSAQLNVDEVRLTRHAFMLFMLAISWHPKNDILNHVDNTTDDSDALRTLQLINGVYSKQNAKKKKGQPVAAADETHGHINLSEAYTWLRNVRFEAFVCDCLLHMLLNDIHQLVRIHPRALSQTALIACRTLVTLVQVYGNVDAVQPAATATVPSSSSSSSSWFSSTLRLFGNQKTAVAAPSHDTSSRLAHRRHDSINSREVLEWWVNNHLDSIRMPLHAALETASLSRAASLHTPVAVFYCPINTLGSSDSSSTLFRLPDIITREFLPSGCLRTHFDIFIHSSPNNNLSNDGQQPNDDITIDPMLGRHPVLMGRMAWCLQLPPS